MKFGEPGRVSAGSKVLDACLPALTRPGSPSKWTKVSAMISFDCPSCRKPLKVKDELAGKHGKCPACGKATFQAACSG